MTGVVYIVDDDETVRRSLCALIESLRPDRVESFASGEAFLTGGVVDQPACLLLDIRIPGMGGLAVLEELKTRSADIPVILMSGHSDAMPADEDTPPNVVAFAEKPFWPQELLDLVRKALQFASSSDAATPPA
ncbi:MAG: response regulator [Pirellulales bacterium]|nr:response regulator [Pirellulales bacterium]